MGDDTFRVALPARMRSMRISTVTLLRRVQSFLAYRGAWASQVKSRSTALEKLLQSDEYIKAPPSTGKPFRFRFPPAPRLGTSEEIVSAEGLGHGYDGRTLFADINLAVNKGERIAFLGPNGAGKSTLLRLIVGEEEPLQGKCTLGSSVVKQYFEQNQADALDLSKTVVETMMGASTTQKYEELRKLLGQFLFKGDAVEKSVQQLSGGEKARVALCKMMLTPASLLVLDEPTNHLDIPAKEMLEEALQHYEGAVLLVSHDRYFVSQVRNTWLFHWGWRGYTPQYMPNLDCRLVLQRSSC